MTFLRKAQIALENLKEEKTVGQIVLEYGGASQRAVPLGY